jgi:transcription initiation factor TFIIIB Brf1 subunit/transcription initiation factor TFIIB
MDLKPCPFCGKEVKMVPEGDYVEIVCEDCGIAMWRGSELWLAADWNMRAKDGDGK